MEEISDGKLGNLRGVVLLNLAHLGHISLGDEIDTHTLSSPPPTATDAMEVGADISRYVKVNHATHRLYINTSCSDVGRDENTKLPRPKLGHSRFALLLGHVRVDRTHGIPISKHSLM